MRKCYIGERLRQRLESMTPEQKKALWDKYSYLNEYGPMVNCCTESFCYGEDIPFTPECDTHQSPVTSEPPLTL